MSSSIRAVVILALAAAAGCGSGRETRTDAPRQVPAPSASPVAASAPAVPAVPTIRPGAHADHDPKHGGLLFMDANLYHHLEGALPEAGVFRLYLYDDYTKPIDSQGTTGAIRVKTAPEGVKIPLEYDAATMTLVARLDPPPPLPLDLELFVNLTSPTTGMTMESTYNFHFKNVGGEAPVAHVEPAGGHSHAAGGHAHTAPHGGQVVTVGTDHHFELVETPGMFTLWILDAAEKSLPVDGMQASLLIQSAGKPAIDLPLPAMGNVHFMANSPLKPGESAVAVASVIMAGKTMTGRFTLGSRP